MARSEPTATRWRDDGQRRQTSRVEDTAVQRGAAALPDLTA